MFSGSNWTDRSQYMHHKRCESGITYCLCTTTYIFVDNRATSIAWRWGFSGPSTTWHTYCHSVNKVIFLFVWSCSNLTWIPYYCLFHSYNLHCSPSEYILSRVLKLAILQIEGWLLVSILSTPRFFLCA